ncbi:hypothetical protein HDU76_001416 [Blyttiomyces sp. JEL0837]|nr:hypothetical protein HDU76_001416 [Blyttiomyces sp. JEL0837]
MTRAFEDQDKDVNASEYDPLPPFPTSRTTLATTANATLNGQWTPITTSIRHLPRATFSVPTDQSPDLVIAPSQTSSTSATPPTILPLQEAPPSYTWDPTAEKDLKEISPGSSQSISLIPFSKNKTSFVEGYNGLGAWHIAGFLCVKNLYPDRNLIMEGVSVVLTIGSRGRSIEKFKKVNKFYGFVDANVQDAMTVPNKAIQVILSQTVVVLESQELKPSETALIPFRFTFDPHLPACYDVVHQSHWTDSFLQYALTGVVKDISTANSPITMTVCKYIPVSDYNENLVARVIRSLEEYRLSFSDRSAEVEVVFPSRFITPGENMCFLLTVRSPKNSKIKVTNIHIAIHEHAYCEAPPPFQTPPQQNFEPIHKDSIKPVNESTQNSDRIHSQSCSFPIPMHSPISLLNLDGIWGSMSISHSIKITVGVATGLGGILVKSLVLDGSVEVVAVSEKVVDDVRVRFPKLMEMLSL